MLTKTAGYLGTHLVIDKETKTWKISSLPMAHPEFNVRDYSDIENVHKTAIKKLLGDNKILLDGDIETRNEKGEFRGIIIST